MVCRVPYIIQLLTEGLGLPEAQVTVGSGKEAWTLGAALAEGSKALHNRSLRSYPRPGLVLSPSCYIPLLRICALLIHQCKLVHSLCDATIEDV